MSNRVVYRSADGSALSVSSLKNGLLKMIDVAIFGHIGPSLFILISN
jgi:hypothetical protein